MFTYNNTYPMCNEVSWNSGYHQIIRVNRIFHCKPSIWGTPIYGNPHIYIYTFTYQFPRTMCIYIYIHVYTYIYICVYIYMCIYIYIQDVYIYMYRYMIHVYIYIYVYIYVYTHTCVEAIYPVTIPKYVRSKFQKCRLKVSRHGSTDFWCVSRSGMRVIHKSYVHE